MLNKDGIKNLKSVKQDSILIFISLLIIALITAQNVYLSDFGFETTMRSFYNNYLIFKNSAIHLLNNENLYVLYKQQQIDLFKYSPSFALFFIGFSFLPNWLGLFLWNILNALVLFSLRKVAFPKTRAFYWVWMFVVIEFVTNIHSSQSNGLMAGLIVLAYVFLEKKNIAMATLMVVLSAYIKIFGVMAFVIFLFYPNKWKSVLWSVMWSVIILILPLIVVSPSELMWQYQNWLELLLVDKPVEYSPSFSGWLAAWFNFRPPGVWIILFGMVLYLIPFIQIKKYNNPLFKQLMLASTLIWVVLFNHKAESPTFIIAITGVALWFFTQPKSWINNGLLILAVVFTELSPTDIFPREIREEYFMPWVVKVVPIILIWLKILYDSFRNTEVREINVSA